MQRITKDKADKAAWPASQPLFNSLKKGCASLEKQSNELKDARDTIKNIHIAIDNVPFGRVCGNIMSHWIQTIEIHRDIFEEIVKLTKTVPGSEPDTINEGFASMLATVHEAAKIADNAVCNIRKNVQSKCGLGGSSSTEESDASDHSSSIMPNVSETSTKERKSERGGEPVILPIHSPKQPVENAAEVKTDAADAPEELPSTRKKSKPKSRKKKHDTAPEATFKPNVTVNDGDPSSTNTQPITSSNSFTNFDEMPPPPTRERKSSNEDISGQVEALLAAKEKKRRLKKESKKRKRDSIASSVFASDVPPDTPAKTPFVDADSMTKTKKVKELPAKKRTKLDTIADIKHDEANKRTHSIDTEPRSSKEVRKSLDGESGKTGASAQAGPVPDKAQPPPPAPTVEEKADINEYSNETKIKLGKSKEKDKRRRSSDGHDQTQQEGLRGDGKRAKRIKTG